MRSGLLLVAFAAIGSLFGSSGFAQTYSITNARIVTVSGATIEKGTIVIRGGLIEAVGADARSPADAQVFDGTGLTVYPGFIDALTSLGITAAAPQPARTPGGTGGTAAAASNSNYPAGLRPEVTVAEELHGGDAQFEANRNAGFTTVLTVGRTGIFSGQSALIDLAGENVSTLIIKAPFAEHISFSTIRGEYPGSLLGTFSALRQMLLDARRLQEIQKLYAAEPKGIRRPDADRSLEALIPILDRQMPVVFNANRVNEIVRALDLAKEFNLNAIIAGGQEAWKLADRLKAQNVPVLLSLNFPKRTTAASSEADPETMDLLRFRAEAPKGAGKLEQAGVKLAFQSGGMTKISDFIVNAAKAVDGGLSKDAALRAMTLGSAEIFGVDDRLGSLEKGKIANLTVVKGDIFDKDKRITKVFVDGRLFEQKEPPPTPPRSPAGTPTGAVIMQVGGNYSITIDVPGQTLTGTMALTQQGAVLTGTMQTQLGTVPIRDGKVTADGFTFSGTVEFGGSSIEIIVKGSVSGSQLTGTIDSPQGIVPLSGTKNP